MELRGGRRGPARQHHGGAARQVQRRRGRMVATAAAFRGEDGAAAVVEDWIAVDVAVGGRFGPGAAAGVVVVALVVAVFVRIVTGEAGS